MYELHEFAQKVTEVHKEFA